MASWGSVIALTGFQYSAIDKTMMFNGNLKKMFWSNVSAWGTCKIEKREQGTNEAKSAFCSKSIDRRADEIDLHEVKEIGAGGNILHTHSYTYINKRKRIVFY
ncbi:hypothetical protein [Lederbergia graminis]|uniref:Uncharacterized protein n=1 Tax=Lederbergia graminis TaxID=735518 RepID=A0ABW0LM66_9BACI